MDQIKHKVFISYSHSDEKYLQQLLNHISIMKKEGLVEEWHDRKLIPGQEWENEISDNLLSATVILLLVSSDFLGSDYCFDIEMKKAMELHESKKAIVIPIILRSCDWGKAPFSKLQALPKDTKPVKKWSDEDDAWLDIAKGLRSSIQKFLTEMELSSKVVVDNVNDKFGSWLEDTEILLTHRRKEIILLSDIYVTPDIRLITDSFNSEFHIKSSLKVITKPKKCIIFGEEQQGKTSLLKRAYQEARRKGLLPVYIDCSTVNTSDVSKVIKKCLSNQYVEEVDVCEKQVVVLLDDFSEIKLNNKAKEKFIEGIHKLSTHIIMTCNKAFSYIVPEYSVLDDYELYNLLRFGHEKRAELTEKWIKLGIEDQISDEKLYRVSDELKIRLDSIIRGNIVPPNPIYVLMLLQMFEASTQQNLELTTYGHCYQELIYRSFRNSDIPTKEFGSYLNILTEFAWTLHKQGSGFTLKELDIFFDEYEKEFLKVERNKITEKLQINYILIVKDGRLQFKYPYLFYFFVAKKIAEGFLKNNEIKQEVSKLLTHLHREDYANILVFVTHHTKDDWILDEIQLTLMELFDDQEEASLSKDKLDFMDEFISQIPRLIIEKREIAEERKKHHQQLDYIDQERQGESYGHLDSNDFLAKINKVFKGMEIAGQIVRNRHASLPRHSLYDLVEQGSNTGLRFLNYFISVSDIAKEEIIRSIESHLREHPNLTNEQVQKTAESTFLLMTYGVIHTMLRKIASAIGSKEAYEIYDQLEQKKKTPAVILLNRAISMHFRKNLNIEEIKITVKEFSNNRVCSRILNELVIQHIYMFPVSYKEKQRLSEIFNISVHQQRILDRQKQIKQ